MIPSLLLPTHPFLRGKLCFESWRTGASFAKRAGAKGFAFKSLHTNKPAAELSRESRWGLWAWGRGRAEEGRRAVGKECPLLYRSASSTLHCGLNTHRVDESPMFREGAQFPPCFFRRAIRVPHTATREDGGLLRWC